MDQIFRGKRAIQFGLVEIRVEEVSQRLQSLCEEMVESIKQILMHTLGKQIESLVNQEQSIMSVIDRAPDNLE